MAGPTLVSVVGARPQFVKAAAIAAALAAAAKEPGAAGFRHVLIHTGQHYDDNMSGVFFDELGIPPPDHHLRVGSGPHGWQTGRMLEALEPILADLKPAWAILYGDTNSTLAGALAAAKLGTPVAHVEAGLRSFNRTMPEEINRVLTDHVSRLLFAPTRAAVENLAREGIDGPSVVLTGDVMYDAVLRYRQAAASSPLPAKLGLSPKGYVLATIHRAENTDDPRRLAALCEGLRRVATRWPVVWPMHPRTRAALAKGNVSSEGLRVIPPASYLEMAALQMNAGVVATDSGGVQKEAFFHRVPCVTFREETEWPELIDIGWNRLSPAAPHAVAAAIEAAWNSHPAEPAANLYGGGQASRKIVAALLEA